MMQADERLNKARKLAETLGVSLSDLRDVVAALQVPEQQKRSLQVNEMPSLEEVTQQLVSDGAIDQVQIDSIDAEVKKEFETFSNLMSSLQNALVEYKSEHNLSVREMADRFGMASRHVQNLLKGVGNPTLQTIAEVARKSGMTFTLQYKKSADTASKNL